MASSRKDRLSLRALRTLGATGLALSALGLNPAVTAAHCPGGAPGYRYAIGTLGLPTPHTGIRGWIGYTNANPCTNTDGNAFTAEWLTLARNNTAVGFVQVGMMKRQGWTAPRYYCEFTGNDNGFWHLHDGTSSLSATAHQYRFATLTSEGTTYWECQFDGAPIIHTHTVGQLGWSSGTFVEAGGEAYATHGQIGANAPSKLGLTVLQDRSGTTWATTNYNPGSPPAPYGIDEPVAGELRNWTNAH